MTDRKPDPTRGTQGNLGAGQSGGGGYANAAGNGGHGGGQSEQGYYGGGQAGDDKDTDSDHHSASRRTGPEGGSTYRDHPSQHEGPTNDRLRAANAGNPDLADEAHAPGDRVQGSDGEIVSGKP